MIVNGRFLGKALRPGEGVKVGDVGLVAEGHYPSRREYVGQEVLGPEFGYGHFLCRWAGPCFDPVSAEPVHEDDAIDQVVRMKPFG